MHIEIDLTAVPPTATLREPDDFTSFRVVVPAASHAHVAIEQLERLAGSRAEDPRWRARLDAMRAYAAERGWVREDGAIRAHVELADPPPEA